MNELRRRTSPILIYDIDPELDEFLKSNRKIYIDQYIQENICLAKNYFRAIRISEFVEPSLKKIESQVVNAFSKFGSAFLNPDFFKTFAVTYPPGFREEFPKYQMQDEYKPEGIIFSSNPWFDWFKDYIFRALSFEKGMLTDFPFCFLIFSPYLTVDECKFKIHEILSRNLPNSILPESENKNFYSNNSHFAFVLFKTKNDKDDNETFDNLIVKTYHVEENFKKDLSNFINGLYIDLFSNEHEKLKLKIDNSKKKKLFTSRSASQTDILLYSSQLFSIGKYEEAANYIQSMMDEKQTLYKKNIYFINLIKTVAKINKPGNELNERNQALKDLFYEDPNYRIPFSFLLLNAVLFLLFIGGTNGERIISENNAIKQNFNILVKLTEESLAKTPILMSIACGIWYDQIFLLQFQSDQIRKAALNLLLAAHHYLNAGMYGHVIRCYCHLQAVLSRSSKTQKTNSLIKGNDTFVCGRIKDNVYLPLQKSWQNLNCFALWQLSKVMAITKQFQSALQLNIILLAAPKCELVPDQEIFSVLHAYFNFLNIDQLILESLPLVVIDQERVKFAEYGGFAFKNYNIAQFDHLLQHHRKKFKVVRDNLQMWRKSKFQCDEITVPIVCGEKNAIIIPFSNQRTAEINLSNLSLIDSNDMITSSCMEKDPSLKSNEMMMIPINFVTNKTGPFSITGISFIYWAILKDTLKLTPFKFVALDNQPSLEATLINFPEQMKVGECCSFTCRLRNFGSADMANVVFVHDAPFSISFANVRDWRMMGNSVSVSLLNQKLKPNESVDVPCYILGRKPGLFKIKMIFSFLANLPLRWRFFPDKRNIKIIERDSFECKILDHPLSTSKKLVYINGTTAEKEATIKNVTILGCKTISNKEEIIPPNSSLSCVREVETLPKPISVAAISSAALRSIAPTPPPPVTSNQIKNPVQMMKASSSNINSLIENKEIDLNSNLVESDSSSDSNDNDSLVVSPRFKNSAKSHAQKNMPISLSASSLKIHSKDDDDDKIEYPIVRPVKSPSLSKLSDSESQQKTTVTSSSPSTPKNSHLINIQQINRSSFQKQAHMSLDPSALKNANSTKKDWREQFLAVNERGFIEVDTQDNLLSQFNIRNDKNNDLNNNYTYEDPNKQRINNNIFNNLNQLGPSVFSLRGTLSAPSIIKFDENKTIEVVLKLKNVGNCETPLLTIFPQVQNSNQLFWVSKVSHKLKPIKPGQETTLSFFLLVCNSGVFDIGYFIFKSKVEEKTLHFTHILSVY